MDKIVGGDKINKGGVNKLQQFRNVTVVTYFLIEKFPAQSTGAYFKGPKQPGGPLKQIGSSTRYFAKFPQPAGSFGGQF